MFWLSVCGWSWTHSFRFSLDPGNDWGFTWARVMYSFLSRFPTRTRIFDSTRPILGKKNKQTKNNNIKTWSGRVHHKAVQTGNDVIDRWWSQLKVIPHQSRWFLSILIWCMRAALNSTYKAADSRQFFTDNLCLQHSAHTSTFWLLRALRLACMWRGNTDSSNKRKQENNSDCSALITLSASMNLVWTTQICAPHDSGPRITVMNVILLMTSLHVNIQTFLCVINVTLAAAATLFPPLCACMRRIVRYEWWTAA